MTTIEPEFATQIRSALDGMKSTGPEPLIELVAFKLKRAGIEVTELDVVSAITVDDPNSAVRKAFHFAVAQWDAEAAPVWAASTRPRTSDRRAHAYDRLELGAESRSTLDSVFPIAEQKDVVIAIPGQWDPWYTEDRRSAHDFYWNAYRDVLERKGWEPETIAGLDAATSDIIGRLADPAAATSYQAKGLVVGYVQSGKTANFTGITAKAIDAGYRLIIVLTGTIELLRGQTQRRLDMELVGEENILGGRDRNDPEAIRDVDYVGLDQDVDWYSGKFLKHGIDINSELGIPSIKRLTSAKKDYRKLGHGLDTLDFRRVGELRDPTKPLFDPSNLFGADVRIAIIKKNTTAMKALIRDLKDIHASAAEIPALIIDDEADQASINTTNPNRPGAAKEARKRTAINALISETLELLPRAQYLGYTATPFANVFVSPDDSGDIFPRDFIVSLQPSSEYMGGKEFHDLEPVDPELKNPTTSNEAAFVRNLHAADDETERGEIRQALDAFVLSGAIKRWRTAQNPDLVFRHHTMLVHESVKQDEHRDLADLIRDVWATGEYSGIAVMARLRRLFDEDFRVVHDAREWGTTMPEAFDELKPFIGDTISEILADGDPVVIVNGSKDSDYDAMDFQRRPYWRVMVGGAKLSRGFTVEGLTVTYYRRRAAAADTLMQMGRWFGYRPGYRDLVRLYIARSVLDGKNKSYDLYDMFTAILEDEEEFRKQLRDFSDLDEEGRPQLTPRDVPPLVFSQLPWLRPAARNRMYNAVLTERAQAGQVVDRFALPPHPDGHHAPNFAQFADLAMGGRELTFLETTKAGSFPVRAGLVSGDEMVKRLQSFVWRDSGHAGPDVEFIRRQTELGKIEDWLLYLPVLGSTRRYAVGSFHEVPIIKRARRAEPRLDFSGSERKHRGVAAYVVGAPLQDDLQIDRRGSSDEAEFAGSKTRGAMLINFSYESARGEYEPPAVGRVEPSDVVTMLTFVSPTAAVGRGRIAFTVKVNSRPNDAIVDLA